MARTKAEPRAGNPGFLSRLRQRKQPTSTHNVVSHEHSVNPITGTHTETHKTKTHPRGPAAGGHGGKGPLAKKHKGTTAAGGVPRRKPTPADKLSGALLKVEGSLERKPGKKVSRCAATSMQLCLASPY